MKKKEYTTLCYILRDGNYLMLHRTKKKNDVNEGKWVGIGGHIEPGETPEECIVREVREETGLKLTQFTKRGVITFVSDICPIEEMHLYLATGFEGTLCECDEGDLAWVKKEELRHLPMWQGDAIFLRLLEENGPLFRLTTRYEGDRLVSAELDGRPVEL